jgi:N-formylglutamate amidohydrolase
MQPFLIHMPEKPPAPPVVFDTPHSGIILPDHFHYACTRGDLMHMHDPHVEKLLTDVPAAGVPVLEALIHKACINLNRDISEIDPAMIDGNWKHPFHVSPYTARKDGLFPVLSGPRLSRISPIYNASARLTAIEAEQRIERYYKPYYAALHGLINRARRQNEAVLHVNVHSSYRQPGTSLADIVLGTVHGQSCPAAIAMRIKAFFEKEGRSVSLDKPFSGGTLVQSSHDRRRNIHSIQIEIARDLYMNQDTLEYNTGNGMRRLMRKLAVNLKNIIPA